MKTKSVTYSDNYNDSMPKLDYKWWLDTNRFWAKNQMSGFKPDSFVKWVEENGCFKNGETTMEQVLRDLEELKQLSDPLNG